VAAALEEAQQHVVRVLVELLHALALDVLHAGVAQHVEESGPLDAIGDHLRRAGDVGQQSAEFARRVGKATLLRGDVPLDRDQVVAHGILRRNSRPPV